MTRIVFFAWAMVWLAVSPAAAQRAPDISASGTVVDQTGAVLPNAHLDVKDAAGSTVQSSTADTVGAFRLNPLAPGRYDLLVTFDGFEPTTVHFTIGARAPAPLRVTLPLARVKQELTVGTAPADVKADAASNLDASTIDQDTLEKLPVFNQDILATMSRFLDASAIGTGTTLIVNGLEVNSLMVPASAIQQIKINSDPYAAEFFRPGRGRIEVITKPASQTFAGTVNFSFRDSSIDARNAFAAARPTEQRRIFEGFVGGPMGRSKATAFTMSFKQDANDTEGIVVAQDLTGPIQQNVPNPSRSIQASATLTHQQGAKNTMAITASYQDDTQHNQGVGGVTLPSAGTNWNSIEQDVIVNVQTVISPKLLHQIRILAGQEFETWTSASGAPTMVVLDAFTGGGAQSDRLRTEHHIQATDTLTWSPGSPGSPGHHVIKAGLNIPDWSRRRWDDNTNRSGTFYFSNLASYAAGQPYSFIEQSGDGHIVFLDKQIGGFFQDEFRVLPNLSLSMGLRYDWQNFTHDTNNVAPRFSFAYAPTRTGTTVVRGGAGIFYDRTGAGPIQDILRYDGQHLLRFVLPDPGYPNPILPGQSAGTEPPSVVRFAPDLVVPYSVQVGLGVERQLRKGTSASVTYTGTRGFDQFRSRDVNAPAPPLYLARPDPTLGVVRVIESAGRLVSHSVQFSLKGQLTRFAIGSAQYTWSHTMNDTGGISWMPPNSYDLSGEYARADGDQRHRFDLLATINPGSLFNLGVALALYSGRPYSITTGFDAFNTGTANARPPGVDRNSAEGPGYSDLDLRWSRDVHLDGAKAGGGRVLTLGLDAFNVLNHVNFAQYVGTETSPFFGSAIAAQPPRRVQLSARLKF